MRTIDADAHVIETLSTFEHMLPEDTAHAPRVVATPDGKEAWLLDGQLHPKDVNIGRDTAAAVREMRDIDARLKHMDVLAIDVQVLYPTMFLRPWTRNPDVERALCRGYNRWLAEIWKKGRGRLRWVAMVPALSMDAVPDEVMRAKEFGACGIFLRGHEAERRLTESYFHPLYALAQALDVPVCVHSASGSYTMSEFFGDDNFSKFKLSTVAGCHGLLMDGTPSLFPRLRWGFIEVSAQWIPYVLNDARLRLKRRGKDLPELPLKANNIYVACQVTDDLPYVLSYAGEDNLVIGTDYGHADNATEIEALRLLKTNGVLPERVVNKILSDNARKLYAI
jgi:predicted TIM-barrel fold metal-dependent hydrolase